MQPKPDAVTPWPVVGLATGLALSGFCTIALVLVLGGGAPTSSPVGLDGTHPSVLWSLRLTPYLVTASAFVTMGFALVGGGFLGRVDPAIHRRAVSLTTLAATAWTAATLVQIGLLAAQYRSMTGDLSAFGASVQVRLLAVEACLAAALVMTVRRWPVSGLVLALVAFVPAALNGHPLTAEAPLLAAGTLVVHTGAASIWVGGLVSTSWLAVRHRTVWPAVLPRYSRLALWCVAALLASGVLATTEHLHRLTELLSTQYGVVVLLKVSALLALLVAGALQRRFVVRRATRARVRDAVLLNGIELVLMMTAMALATGLAQTPPP